jgi:hypothetical protein
MSHWEEHVEVDRKLILFLQHYEGLSNFKTPDYNNLQQLQNNLEETAPLMKQLTTDNKYFFFFLCSSSSSSSLSSKVLVLFPVNNLLPFEISLWMAI